MHRRHSRRSTLVVLAVACALLGALPLTSQAALTITKGPYLLNVTTTGLTVAWQTDSASDSRVTFTPTGGAATTTSIATAVTSHQVRLSGLSADTSYSYQVSSTGTAGSVSSAVGSFRTAPAGAAAFRFAVYGDSRSQPSVHAQVAAAVRAAGPRLVLDSGDLSADSTSDSTFQSEFFLPARPLLLNVPFYPTLGNHEGESSLYYRYFAGLPTGGGTGGVQWYSFDYGNAHFAVLDTNVGYSPGTAQYQWFVNDMQRTTAEWRFVMTHHPAYSSGTHGSDPAVDSYLVPLFESYHVDAVFHGHDHIYERSLKNGVTYFVAGGAGAPLYPVNATYNPYQKYARSAYHFITVDVNGSTATLQARDVNGTVFDSVTLTHAAPAGPAASFTANPTSGAAPLTVYFTDTSTNSPTSWLWNFGDGTTSTLRSPSHTYSATGTYTVRLTASNAAGSSSATGTVTVQGQSTSGHTVTVTASATPTTVASGGTVTLSMSGTDSQGHTGLAWQWSDGGAGGTFSSTTAQNPTYRAPANSTSTPKVVTLTATAICKWQYPWVNGNTVSLPITVNGTSVTPPHTLSITASASPASLASAGTTALSASGSDSLGHAITSWNWSDGGAGGTFSSSTAQSPTYAAPANTGTSARSITLSVTGVCSGGTSATGTVTVSVAPAPAHALTVRASASPGSVASAGTTTLTGAATDSLGHPITSWSWSDGGAGGTFSSATAQSPTYTAPANTGTSARTVTLTLTASCGGATPISASGSTALTVAGQPATGHAVTVQASASAASVASSGTVTLSLTGTDSQGHGGLAYQWSDNGAGGSFSAPTAATTTYRAPANTSGSPRSITLTATAICKWQWPWVQGSATLPLTVTSGSTGGGGHAVTVTASASASSVASGGTVSLSMSGTDSLGHGGLAWQWSDGGAGGTFSSATAQNPTYRAPANTSGSPRTITLSATAICKWQWPWVNGNTISLPLTVTSP